MTYELKKRCGNCDRFIPIKAVGSSEIQIKCSDRKCKQWQTVKIIMMTDILWKT